jgi:UDP-glucose 6-dehydrogenase
LLCEKLNINYNNIKDLMLSNNWINPMHTTVPGPDGQLSYGGLCFPKDTNALNELMKKYDSPNAVMNSVIQERNTMRYDKDNCK